MTSMVFLLPLAFGGGRFPDNINDWNRVGFYQEIFLSYFGNKQDT